MVGFGRGLILSGCGLALAGCVGGVDGMGQTYDASPGRVVAAPAGSYGAPASYGTAMPQGTVVQPARAVFAAPPQPLPPCPTGLASLFQTGPCRQPPQAQTQKGLSQAEIDAHNEGVRAQMYENPNVSPSAFGGFW